MQTLSVMFCTNQKRRNGPKFQYKGKISLSQALRLGGFARETEPSKLNLVGRLSLVGSTNFYWFLSSTLFQATQFNYCVACREFRPTCTRTWVWA